MDTHKLDKYSLSALYRQGDLIPNHYRGLVLGEVLQ